MKVKKKGQASSVQKNDEDLSRGDVRLLFLLRAKELFDAAADEHAGLPELPGADPRAPTPMKTRTRTVVTRATASEAESEPDPRLDMKREAGQEGRTTTSMIDALPDDDGDANRSTSTMARVAATAWGSPKPRVHIRGERGAQADGVGEKDRAQAAEHAVVATCLAGCASVLRRPRAARPATPHAKTGNCWLGRRAWAIASGSTLDGPAHGTLADLDATKYGGGCPRTHARSPRAAERLGSCPRRFSARPPLRPERARRCDPQKDASTMAVEVYHEPLCRRYYASRCSCAYFFFLLIALVD